MLPCFAGVISLPGRPEFHCPSNENVLAKVEFDGRGGSGPIVFAAGANHYRLIGLEVTRAVSSAVVYNLIGPNNAPADHLIFDRMCIHGTPQDETVRGVMLAHVRYGAVIDSYFSDFHCVAKTGGCADSQAIAGGFGDDPMGPFKIVNNFLEAAAESIELGGSGATATPMDIEIRRNHLFKPLIWMTGQPGFVGGVDGGPFIVKNLFELKNAVRVLFEGNVLENTWGGFSQAGFADSLRTEEPGQLVPRTSVRLPSDRYHDSILHYQPCRQPDSSSETAFRQMVAHPGMAAGTAFMTSPLTISSPNSSVAGEYLRRFPLPPAQQRYPLLHDVSIDHVTAFAPRSSVYHWRACNRHEDESRLHHQQHLFWERPSRSLRPVVVQTRIARRAAVPSTLDGIFQSIAFLPTIFRIMSSLAVGEADGRKTITPRENRRMWDSTILKDFVGGEYRLSATSKFKRSPAMARKTLGADIDAIEKATISGVQ